MKSVFFAVTLLLVGGIAVGKEPRKLLTSPAGVAFGSAPTLWHLRLSPDGSKISFIQMHASGATIARVLDTAKGQVNTVIAGERDRYDVIWCDWANDERLLCGFRAVVMNLWVDGYLPLTRLVAVNADGGERRILLERRLRNEFTQYQDRVVDWMPDDSEHVLVQMPETGGSGVSRLNIYSGRAYTDQRVRKGTYAWLADGAGNPRLRRTTTNSHQRWWVRQTPDGSWRELKSIPLTDLSETFEPVGFGATQDELLFFTKHNGRRSLFAQDISDLSPPRLVYSHDRFDLSGVLALGRRKRLVAAIYIDDRPRQHFFDTRIEGIQSEIAALFPGKGVSIFDEDWSERYYLLSVGSDRDPGTYYRYDSQGRELTKLSVAQGSLEGRPLAAMRVTSYPGADGVAIPAYLTLPESEAKNLPAVILPHGGPSARDSVGFDFLVQYLAAKGFAVLQSNYRGSSGYGRAWEGEGAFKGWRLAVSDISAGADYLIREGIADPNRLCIVGWSYGGYAALMSLIEEPERYQCGVSIAGVTDPESLSRELRRWVGGKAAREFIGFGAQVLKYGSPYKRAAEIEQPVLLIHPEQDVNVPIDQSKKLEKALRRKKKPVTFVEYEHAEHSIRPERYRIDLLTRLGEFLEDHT